MRESSIVLREHILTVASDLFYRKGIRKVGIDEIVERAGIARMTLYNHFGSKDRLIEESLRRESSNWLETYLSRIRRSAPTPRGRLLAALSVLEQWFRHRTFRGCWITNASVELKERKSPAQEVAREHQAALRALYVRLAEEAGVERAEELAETYLLLLRGATVSALLDRDPSAALRARRAAEALLAEYSAPSTNQ